MEISKEFILSEMEQVQLELQKAQVFVIQAETSLAIYKMLLERLNQQGTPNDDDSSEAS